MGKGNPNPNRSGMAPPFRPGQSGNPGGKTSEQRRLEIANAEAATRIRSKMLALFDRDDITPELSSELLKLLKDSEDRGLGAPKQPLEHGGLDGGPLPITKVEVRFIGAPGDDGDVPA